MPGIRRIHGGRDSAGVPRFDFSTNSNACGPCPQALQAIQQADPTTYPDASYARLRDLLAAFHGVDPPRIVLAASASEFIFRITAVVAKRASNSGRGPAALNIPPHSYGDYAQAADAWGLTISASPDRADLVWACEPSSPLGQLHTTWPPLLAHGADLQPESILVLDRAYEPLRLEGNASLSANQLSQVWQLWTPNKALGLTGIRAAYAIAPANGGSEIDALEAMAPSWPVGAHGVALLQAWVQPDVQMWLADSLGTLRQWKSDQLAALQSLGWTCLPSAANFFCAKPPQALHMNLLRDAGIKLRDTTSFGLPGYFRLSVQGPEALTALRAKLQSGLI